MMRPCSGRAAMRTAPRATAAPRLSFPTQSLRRFATEAGKDVFTEVLKPLETKAKEKPKQLFALGRFQRIQTSTKRLNDVCHIIRGQRPIPRCAGLTHVQG